MKNPFASKTLWLNVLVGAATILVPQAQDAVSQHPTLSSAILTGANIALRFVTNQPINFSPQPPYVSGR